MLDCKQATEQVTITPPKGGTKRTFLLIEHTGEELDQYIEETSKVYDRAIENLRESQRAINFGHVPDPQEAADLLYKVKEEVAEHSAELIVSLLHPTDGLVSIDSQWIRKNTTRRTREKILNAQNELDGIETVQDQSFLIERQAQLTALQILRQANHPTSNLVLNSDSPEDSTPTITSSIPESQKWPESPQAARTVILPDSEHVSIEDINIVDDGTHGS